MLVHRILDHNGAGGHFNPKSVAVIFWRLFCEQRVRGYPRAFLNCLRGRRAFTVSSPKTDEGLKDLIRRGVEFGSAVCVLVGRIRGADAG